jgi:hypothetical protein
MPAMQCACPKCQQTLQIAQALPARVECPRCKTRFVVGDRPRKDKAELIRKDRDAVRGIARGAAPAVRAAAPAAAPVLIPTTLAGRGRSSGKGPVILIAILLALLLVGGIILALVMNRGSGKKDEEPRAEIVLDEPPVNERQRKIDNAVSLGVNYLRREVLTPTEKNYYFTDPGAGSNVGVLALAGLTLLECGLPPSDAAIEKVLKTVREQSPRLTFTYSVALCILFLDRLNHAPERAPDPADKALIQRLAVQMMAAQNGTGGWGYSCPLLAQDQYEAHLADIKANRFRPGTFAGTYDDNSINQFCTLALWAARKHDIKTDAALAMVERRYQQNQNEDGSWGYRARDNGYLKDATTCAGLIGLAVGQGIRDDKATTKAQRDPTKDLYIAKGLAYVAKGIGKDPRRMSPKFREDRRKHTSDMLALNRLWQEGPEADRPAVMKRINDLDKAPLLKGTYFNSDSWGDLYFLWSVERVGVIFDLRRIGGKDWYDWGTDIILANQKEDGSWRDRFPGIPDTCFALLFLRRVNIAKDLTDKFRLLAGGPGIGGLPEPGGQIPPLQAPRKK